MRILVYGAGPLGSLFAHSSFTRPDTMSRYWREDSASPASATTASSFHNVTNDQTVIAPVRAVETLAPDDAYDLVLVVMRKNAALTILPALAANRHTPDVLFLMNNAAGPGALIEALGRERVLIGFPASAGYRDGATMHCLTGTPDDKAVSPFGEIDGSVTARAREIASVIASTPWLGAEIRSDMDAWLKYHVALLMPSIAAALYACGTDLKRMARTRDAVVLAVRAVHEGFAVLRELGYPVTPGKLELYTRIPEPLMVPFLRKVLTKEHMEIALAKTRQRSPGRDPVPHR